MLLRPNDASFLGLLCTLMAIPLYSKFQIWSIVLFVWKIVSLHDIYYVVCNLYLLKLARAYTKQVRAWRKEFPVFRLLYVQMVDAFSTDLLLETKPFMESLIFRTFLSLFIKIIPTCMANTNCLIALCTI